MRGAGEEQAGHGPPSPPAGGGGAVGKEDGEALGEHGAAAGHGPPPLRAPLRLPNGLREGVDAHLAAAQGREEGRGGAARGAALQAQVREVRRRAPAQERLPLLRKVPGVLRAQRGGGDVEHVAGPVALVLGLDAVDQVRVPPHRVPRVHLPHRNLSAEQRAVPPARDLQRVPPRRRPAVPDPAKLVGRDVVAEGPQEHVGRRLRHHGHHLEAAVAGALRGEREPALERPEEAPRRRRPPPHVPGVVVVDPALHEPPVHLLPGGVGPAAHGPVVHVLLHPRLPPVPRYAVPPAVDVRRLHLGQVEGLARLLVHAPPQPVEPHPDGGEALVLAGLDLRPRVVHLLHAAEGEGLGVRVVVDAVVRLRVLGVDFEVVLDVVGDVLVHRLRQLPRNRPPHLEDPRHLDALDHRRLHPAGQDVLDVDGGDPPLPVRQDAVHHPLHPGGDVLPYLRHVGRHQVALQLRLVDVLLAHPLAESIAGA
mmetsp:Transcript_26538/g.55116  ORF Transcript_26538/g.55116 Transcript_26538/m.55116 type:complete len:479 (-) Transcript_26538:562-1998(-)